MDPEFKEWLDSRPPVIQKLGKLRPPDREYRLAAVDDEAVYRIYSYNENGTLSALRFQDGLLTVRVFGLAPEDLVPREF